MSDAPTAEDFKWSLDQRGDRAMSAYYYGFARTGVEAVDRILAEVAWAGKAYHSTEHWYDEDVEKPSVADRIQIAAISAAREIAAEAAARDEAYRQGLEAAAEFTAETARTAEDNDDGPTAVMLGELAVEILRLPSPGSERRYQRAKGDADV